MSPNHTALVAAILCCIAGNAATAAGVQRLEIAADGEGPALAGAVWTPCAKPDATVILRRIEVPGVRDCPVTGERLPLVVLSHGYNGWFGGHHDTAAPLANAGFVVAAITHPNENDRRWRWDRPAAIKRVIDHMLARWPDRARLDGARIGVFGFSRGGYTGLVVIGGEPDFTRIVRHCAQAPGDPICRSRSSPAPSGPATPQAYVHHRRIKAAVVAAPLGVVFGLEGLKAVTAPVQLWRAEKDERAIHPYNAEAVRRALPSAPDYRVVPKAGHFIFLAPCSERQAQAVPALCRDAPGIDRAAFHRRFNAEVVAFFRKHLR